MTARESEPREHRIPKEPRSSFPTCWVLWYTWRRLVFFTPKVRLRAWQIIVTTLPTHGFLLGLSVSRDEDDEWVVMVGLGLIEVEVHTLVFLPDRVMDEWERGRSW